MNDCKECEQLRKDLETCRKLRKTSLVATDPDGAKFRMAARFCQLLLVKYVPREEWPEYDRLHPWLLEPEVARHLDL